MPSSRSPRWFSLVACSLAFALFAGCPQNPFVPIGAPEPLGTVADNVSSNLFGLDFPSVPAGKIVVKLVSDSFHDAHARVTMRVAGQLVRQVNRRVAALTQELFIGPDFADSVLIEATVLDDPPRSVPLGNFQLGTHFATGDTILFTIPADPVEPIDNTNSNQNQNDNGNQNQNENHNHNQNQNDNIPQPEFIFQLQGLSQNLRINPGTPVLFHINVDDVPLGASLQAFAFSLSNDHAPQIPILDSDASFGLHQALWDTTGVKPDLYGLAASVVSNSTAVTVTAEGNVRINAPASIIVTDPRDDLIITRGEILSIAFAGQDDDDNASITLFLDNNTNPDDGVVRILAADVPEDDLDARQFDLDTAELSSDSMFAGATISDGLTSQTDYSGVFCITNRYVGRYEVASIRPYRRVLINPDERSRHLGTDVDISQDIDLDGFADLLLSDPLESHYSEFQPGSVYLHPGSDNWPSSITRSDLHTRIVGDSPDAHTGARAALAPSIDADNLPDVLIGAPLTDGGEQPHAGRAFALSGPPTLRKRNVSLADDLTYVSTVDLKALPTTPKGIIATRIDGIFLEQAGRDVAPIGDVNADGRPDYAIGAAHFGESREGRAAIIAGGRMRAILPLSSVGGPQVPGIIAHGDTPDGRAGFALASAGDHNNDGIDDFLISAPRARRPDIPDAPRAGVVYLLYGRHELLNSDSNALALHDVGDSEGHPGLVFVGEHDGDLAGASVASGDFDADGLPDILIGAPSFDLGRGRVYLITHRHFPSRIVELALVGSAFNGATFDGPAPGDQLGFSLSNAGDFDNDGIHDLLLAAPGAFGATGSTFLLYGGQGFSGPVSLLNLPRCNLLGLEFVGHAPLARFGASLSGGGDVNGDGFGDIAVGAPGDPDSPDSPQGRAYIFFGK